MQSMGECITCIERTSENEVLPYIVSLSLLEHVAAAKRDAMRRSAASNKLTAPPPLDFSSTPYPACDGKTRQRFVEACSRQPVCPHCSLAAFRKLRPTSFQEKVSVSCWGIPHSAHS